VLLKDIVRKKVVDPVASRDMRLDLLLLPALPTRQDGSNLNKMQILLLEK